MEAEGVTLIEEGPSRCACCPVPVLLVDACARCPDIAVDDADSPDVEGEAAAGTDETDEGRPARTVDADEEREVPVLPSGKLSGSLIVVLWEKCKSV